MSDEYERELYWYDDATYDIGFYNYYQRTVDPSPWAFIVCFSFCVTLAMLLPRYLSYYRILHTNEETKGKPPDNESNNNSIILGSQELIASDDNPHDNYPDYNWNAKQSRDNSWLPPIPDSASSSGNSENITESKVSPKSKLKRERAFGSIHRLIQQTKSSDKTDTNTQSSTHAQGELDHSTDYANMEDDESVHNPCGASDKEKISRITAKKSKETRGKVHERKSYGELIGNKAKGTASQLSPESETSTSNSLQMIKNDLEDFTKGNSNPYDILMVASSWEEEFDPVLQTTVYIHTKTGTRTMIGPISDEMRPWYLFYCSSAFRRKIRKCRRWDDEMEKILRLALPYTAHTIVVDVFRLLEVGVIGRLLGTSNLSAYFATEFAISFATMFFHGILASLKVLVSQAHGANNVKLAGTYVQIGIWTHLLFSLPLILFGWNNFDDIVLRLGLDEDTAESAEQYARFVLIYEAIGIYDGALHCVLDVTGHENYSAISNGVRAFVSFITVLIVSNGNERAELWMVGAIHLIVKVLFVFFNVCVIFRRQWLGDYWNEVGSNPFKDLRPVKTLWKASLRLSSGRVIENCEWNILFVFAAIQGPAEVAIWGLVGELWDFADDIVIAFSDASKVRCAHLLGSGLPEQAKYSAEKCLLMGVAVSIIMSISLGFLQSAIPRWLTNDFTLQRLLGDMIPMVCLAVATLSFGSVCWSLLCAQGRSHLATAVTGFGSLAIALPLASLSNFCFNLNLQGLMSCLIIGYACSGFFNSILMLTSNWPEISQKVRQRTTHIEEKLETNKALCGNLADSESTEVTGVETGD
jgi:Na+-driven multidrug efflux pump